MKKFLIFIFIVILALFGFGYYQYNSAMDKLLPYTNDAKRELPSISITKDDLMAKRRLYTDFVKDIESGKFKGAYEIAGQEANVFVKDIDKNVTFTKWVVLDVVDSKVQAKFSIPLENISFFPSKKFKGKFLNGSGNIEVKYTKDNPDEIKLKFSDVLVGDKEIKELEKDFEGYPLKSLFENNESLKKIFSNIDSISIEGGKIIIKAKGSEEEKGEEVKEASDDEENVKDVLKDI